VNFVCDDGTKFAAKAKVGDNLLDVVLENDLDLDGFGKCFVLNLIHVYVNVNAKQTEPCNIKLSFEYRGSRTSART